MAQGASRGKQDQATWPAGGGAAGELVRRTAWAATPLGPAETWPSSLRATVDMLLGCAFPMVALWGPELVQIYNSGYAAIMGAKHPCGMGQRTADCWPEVWEFNHPIYERVRRGETVTLENQLFPITRHGYLEDAFFTLCYSPLRDESEAIAGVLVTVFETTHRIKAEADLEQSEGRLRALVSASSYVVYRMSPDWTEMLRLEGGGFLAHRMEADRDWLQHFILPEDRPQVLAAIQDAIQRKGIFELEHRVVQADGSVGWTSSRAVPLLDGNGEITEWFGAASDVTARKAAETELRESREQLQAIFDGTYEYIGLLAPDGTMLNSNRASLEFDKLRLGDVVGRPAWETAWGAHTPGAPEGMRDAIRRAAAGEFVRQEFPLRRANGDVSTFDCSLYPIRDENGRVVYLVLEGRDISDRKRMEEGLRESEERYRTLFEQMGEGFCLGELRRDETGKAIDWRYILMNPALEKNTGMSVEASTGRWFEELFPGVDRSYWLGVFQEVVDTQTPKSFEEYWAPIDRWLSGTASPASDGRYTIFYQDVTERKRNELARRESEERQTFLLKLSDALRPLADGAEIQNETTRLLGEHLGVDRCYYFETDYQTGEYIIRRDFKRGELRSLVGRHRIQQWPEMTAALSRGEVLVVHDYANSPDIPPEERAPTENLDIRAIILIPLVKHGSLVACMAAIQAVPRRWTSGEVSLVADVAERTWAAVERGRAEEALRKSEEQYRVLFESIDEGVMTFEVFFDEDGRAIDWVYLETNPALTRMTGFTSDIIGKRASEVYSHLEPYWLETFGRVAKTGEPVRAENFVGELGRWFDFYASRVGGEGSHKVATVYSDITERKRTEAALREAQERQAFLLKLSDALRPLRNRQEIEQVAMRLLCEHLGVRRASYYEMMEDEEHVKVVQTYSADDRPDTTPDLSFSSLGSLGAAYRAGQTLLFDDTAIDTRLEESTRRAALARGERATLGVPLLRGERLIAVVSVHHATPHAWTAYEVSMLQETAERTWSAVERARVEAALHASEARLTAVFESLPVGLAMLDPVGKAVVSNAEFRRFIPKHFIPSRDPERQRRWRAWDAQGALLAPEDYPGARAMRGERVVPGQEMLYTDDGGREIWTSVATVPIRDDDGRLTGQACVVSDIDIEKRAADLLRESEAQKRFLLKLSDALREEPDADAVTKRALLMLMDQLGIDRCYTAVFHLEDDWAEYTHQVGNDQVPAIPAGVRLSAFPEGMRIAADRSLVIDSVRTNQELSDTDKQSLEHLQHGALVAAFLRKGNKDLLWVLAVVTASPRRWTPNEIALVEEAAERTWAASERARAERAVRESEERLRLFVENVREYALVQTDPRGTVTSWNPGAQRLFGYESNEIVGQPFATLLPEKDRHDGIIAREMEKLSQRKPNRDAHAMQRKDGTQFWAEWITEPVLDDAGNLRGTAKVIRDETDRERAVTRRLIAVEEEERRRLARELHDDLGQRAALVGLEAGQLRRLAGTVPISAEESLGRLGSYVAALSEGIRDVSHRLHPTVIADLGLAVALRALVDEYRKAGTEVRLHVEEIPQLAIATATALYRIAQESLGNAERHAPGAPVAVSLMQMDHHVELCVEDAGPGFDLEVARKKGTLGLTSMQERAQIAGGKLHIETAPGRGTTVRMRVALSVAL